MSAIQQPSAFNMPPANEPGSGSGEEQDKPDLDAMATRFGADREPSEEERSDDAPSRSGRLKAVLGVMVAVATLATVAVVLRRVLPETPTLRSLLGRVGFVDRENG